MARRKEGHWEVVGEENHPPPPPPKMGRTDDAVCPRFGEEEEMPGT